MFSHVHICSSFHQLNVVMDYSGENKTDFQRYIRLIVGKVTLSPLLMFNFCWSKVVISYGRNIFPKELRLDKDDLARVKKSLLSCL
jgi:hypothetical protein